MKRTKTTMNLRYNIPLDLIIEILLRLPAKSVLRFRCVSKSWCSIISGQQFIDAFMSRPPGLVFVLRKSIDEDRVFVFSSPHQSCSLSSSSILVAEKNILTIPRFRSNIDFICNSVRGFVCCFLRDRFVVCNPSTGQVIPLAESYNKYYYGARMYLGYDPNNNQYKVLRISYPNHGSRIEHSVCTLGGGQSHSWRPIKASSIPNNYHFYQNGVCIDGVVYYPYSNNDFTNTNDHPETILSSFDVESEQLRHIAKPEGCLSGGELTNYLGKLAVYRPHGDGFTLWVLDDVKNQVWSQKTCCVFPSFTHRMLLRFHFEGITTSGEIVYVPFPWVSDSFEVLCYDVEKCTERRVRVEGHAGCIKAALNCSSTTDLYTLRFIPSLLCSYVDNVIYL